jgi:hypothetical protein
MEELAPRLMFSFTPTAGEIDVNTATTGNSNTAVVAMSNSGSYVVVWQANIPGVTNGFDIYAQLYNSSGVAQGGNFLVNQTTANDQTLPAVAMDSSGGFVVAWMSNQAPQTNIYARVFSAAGTALTNELDVSNVAAPIQAGAPAVAMDASGAFVVAWDVQGGPAANQGIYSQTFSASGTATDSAQFVYEPAANPGPGPAPAQGQQIDPAVAMDSAGSYVIAWISQSGPQSKVYGQLYSTSGLADGSPFLVGTTNNYQEANPTAGMDQNGNFTIAWSEQIPGPNNWDILARQFNAAGTALLANPIAVNTYTNDVQQLASLAELPNGQFAVAWESNNEDGNNQGIYAQVFTSAGAEDGGQFQVNTTTQGPQETPHIAWDGTNAVISWDGQTATDNQGIAAQRFTATMAQVDQSPTVSIPGAQSTNEDAALTFSTAASNAVTVGDPDGSNGTEQVTLTATNGTITLATLANLSLVAGTGTKDTTVTVQGELSDLNAAFNGMTFTPTAGFSGSASLVVSIDDLGNTGSGGPLTTSKSIAISVAAVADTATVTDAVTNENHQTTTGLVITSSSNLLGLDDFQITNITGGTLYQNNGTTQITDGEFITTAQADAGLKFTPTSNSTATGSFGVQTSTLLGIGGLSGSVAPASVTVKPVPILTTPVAQATPEDNALTFSSTGGNAIVVSDPGAPGGTATVTLTATGGTISLPNDSLVVINSGTGIDDTAVSFTGTLSALNTALGGLVFTPTSHTYGSASIAVGVAEGSNTASGTVPITVDRVAHTPTATDAATIENVQTTTGLLITPSTLDSGLSGYFQITSITGGTLFENDGTTQIIDGTFITFAQGGAGLKWTPNANSTGTGSFTVQASTTSSAGGLGGTTVTPQITVTSVETPFPGPSPATVPGTIQTENFDNGGQGVAYNWETTSNLDLANYRSGPYVGIEASSDTGGGDDVCFTEPGDWLNYSVDATTTGSYSLGLRVAQVSSGGQVHVNIDGQDVTGEVDIPSTGGWQTWTTVTITGIDLTAGDHLVQVDFDTAAAGESYVTNLNWMQFSLLSSPNGPAVSAGADQTITHPFPVTLAGSVSESYPPFALTSSWTQLSGPGTAAFADAANADTTATFSVPGTYVLQLAGSDGVFTNDSTVTITVNPDPGPTVSAGSDQSISIPNAVSLLGSITESPLAPGLTLGGVWTQISGPGEAIFANANSPTTTANFTQPGSYVLELTGSDGITVNTSQVTITVIPAPQLSVPGPLSASEDTSLAIGGTDAIAVSDPDDPGATATVALHATAGTLTLASRSGLAFNIGTGTDDTDMNFTGALSAVNAALDGLTFLPSAHTYGTAGISITATEGAFSASGDLAIIVNRIAHTPSVTDATTLENQQTTGGLVITPNALDSDAAGFFKITGIIGGALYQNDGVTHINDGEFITFAQGQAGLLFTPTAISPANGSFTIQSSLSASDAGLGGSTVGATITVISPPAVTLGGTTLTYTEMQPAESIDPALTVSDTDNNTLIGATVQLIGNVPGEDVLTFSNQNGISGAFDAGSGVLTLSGTASAADYQSALRSVTYADTSFDPATSARSVSVMVSDVLLSSQTASRPLQVISVNNPPVVSTPVDEQTLEDSPLVLSAGAGDAISVADVDGGNGVEQISLNATGGTVTLAPHNAVHITAGAGVNDTLVTFTGTLPQLNAALNGLTFTPSESFSGEAAIAVTVDDLGNTGTGGPQIDVETMGISVIRTAHTPAVTDATTLENTQSSAGLVVTPNALDSNLAGYYQVTGITGGSLYQSDGVTPIDDWQFISFADGSAGLRFTPDKDSVASGSFSIHAATAADAQAIGGASATATITVTALPLTIKSAVVNAFSESQTPIGPAELQVLRADGSAPQVVYQIASLPQFGTLRLGSTDLAVGSTFSSADVDHERLQYVSDVASAGQDAFTFTASDAEGATLGVQTLSISLAGRSSVTPRTPIPPADSETVVIPASPSIPDLSPEPATPATDSSKGGNNGGSAHPTPIAPPAPAAAGGNGSPSAPAGGALNVAVTVAVESGLKQSATRVLQPDDQQHAAAPIEQAASPESVKLLEQVFHTGKSRVDDITALDPRSRLWNDLDSMHDKMSGDSSVRFWAGTASVFSIGLPVVYIAYAVRAGTFLSSLMSSIPGWSIVDPLPILNQMSNDDDSLLGEDEEEDKGLGDLVEKNSDETVDINP